MPSLIRTVVLAILLVHVRADVVSNNQSHVRNNTDNDQLVKTGDTDEASVEQEYFVRKIFDKYGHNGLIEFEAFEHLLESLGLAKMQIDDHDIHDHIAPNQGFQRLHNDHIHYATNKKRGRKRGKKRQRKTKVPADGTASDLSRHKRYPGNAKLLNELLGGEYGMRNAKRDGGLNSIELPGNDDFAGNVGYRDENVRGAARSRDRYADVIAERQRRAVGADRTCLTSWEMLNVYSVRQENGISEDAFLRICPAMVYQLDTHACTHKYRQDCFHDKTQTHLNSYHAPPGEGVAAGVTVATGHGGHDVSTDEGHVGHSHGVVSEKMKNWNILEIPGRVWGFATLSVTIISAVGLLGVAIVPIMQKVFYNHLIQFLVALAVGSLTGDALLHLLPHAILASSGGDEKAGVYKGLVALAGIYFFFIAERVMAIVTEKRKKKKLKARRRRSLREAVVGQKLSDYDGLRSHSCEDIVMVLGPNKAGVETQMLELREHASHGHSHDTEIDNEAEVKVKGHGHSHGDGKPPTSIAAVAWMVILGDGLHNFSDGLAIGAAFANSLTGGLSTSVAVFCHELPHELGDFAVLLKAGMSAKQALFYNLVSSVLCFAGMFIGVALGNISSASLWIFAVAGGMFVYIALVDMLPEISTVETRPGENVCCHLLLHLCGITCGLAIMLLIALFEDQIRISVAEEP